MPASITITTPSGLTRKISEGQIVQLNESARGRLGFPSLEVDYLYIAIIDMQNTPPLVGLEAPSPIPGWHDLDGHTEHQCGFWIEASSFGEIFDSEKPVTFQVIGGFKHRGKKLQGKTCKFLSVMSCGDIFVEFGEDVGGCSADGLGKSGHCIAIRKKYLKEIEHNKKEKS